MKKESKFQKELIDDIYRRYPGAIVMKNDPNYIQGIPDLTILYRDRWATLECKKTEKAKHRPNQDYYVSRMRSMSYSSFIYPENREKVLNELEQALKPGRTARVSKRKQKQLAEEDG